LSGFIVITFDGSSASSAQPAAPYLTQHEARRLRDRRVQIVVLGLFAASALCACSVGPSFKRPTTPTPAAYIGRDESARSGFAAKGAEQDAPSATDFGQHILLGATPAANWWQLFEWQPLDELMRRATSNNHTLAAARATLLEAEELVAAQSGARYPQVSVDAEAGRQKYGKQFLGPLSVSPFSYLAVGATVHYTLDYTGGIARSVEQREALAQYRQNEVEAAYLALTGNVALQAMIIASTRAQLQAVSELLAEDRDNLNLVRAAFQNGSVSKTDVLTAESQLASDETLLPPLYHQLNVARHALAVLVGQTPADWSPPDFELNEIKLPRELPVSLPSELVHRRPDILAAEAQLHAATAAVGIATASLYPQITLTASGGQQALPASAWQLFDRSGTAWSLISGLTAPIFDGGTLRAERRATIDELHASAERYQQTVLESFGQVADVLDALSQDAGSLAAQTHALATAQSSLELSRQSYGAGNTGILQVLDAQRQRQQAQLGFVRAQAQQYLDTTELYLALGGSGL
jgi:NodT family efflux transporter outer membrane factor (OMF) lipoprotein